MKKKNKKEIINRPFTEEELIKYISTFEKDALIYPSNLVFEYKIDYEKAEKILEELVKKDKLEKR